jgi:CMP/dCMP kinase
LNAPVITVDGPTASGKGTIAARVAAALGWHYLDSGALYRLVGLQALGQGVNAADESALAALAQALRPRFEGDRVFLGERDIKADVTEAIRAEAVGNMASQIAVLPRLRAALIDLQRGFCRPPGLVADGRDMGTVVFPDAALKVFLTASVGLRASRRHKQLIEKGISANLADLLATLQERDARDSQRATAPLKPALGAYVLDSSMLGIDETVQAVINKYKT